MDVKMFGKIFGVYFWQVAKLKTRKITSKLHQEKGVGIL